MAFANQPEPSVAPDPRPAEGGTQDAPALSVVPATKGFYVGYPLGHTIPTKNDAAIEALLDYCHGMHLGKYPWCAGLHYLGSIRVEGIRIDDNRNDLCRMFLEAADKNPLAQVLVQLDRDEVWPPDGVVQLAQTCTEETPVVCGVYFQRSLDSPYPHVYRYLEDGVGRWGEPCRISQKLGREVLAKIEAMQVPDRVTSTEVVLRLAAPDGTPLPEDLRLLAGAYGGTGFVALHHTLLRKMRELGPPYYPWFREGQPGHGEKGDMAFFNNVQALGVRTVVDCSVFAGHLGEVLIGLPDFMRESAAPIRLERDYEASRPIERVAVVIPTLDPEAAGRLLNDVRDTAGDGITVQGVIVADYPRRGGTRTLNDGLSAAMRMGTDAVLLLDDDLSFPEDGWLARLCTALEPAKVGAVGPSIQCRGPQGKPLDASPGIQPHDMPFLVGACVLYKRAALEHVGPLDEHLRHYHSDTDHCLLLRKAAWRLVWVPEVHVTHHIAGSGFDPAQWDADGERFEAKWNLQRGSAVSVVGAGQPPPQETPDRAQEVAA